MLSLKQKQSGFTIVELLIVIVIIGILAGLVIVTFVGIQARARDSERQSDIKALQSQLEAYNANAGGYPSLTDINDPTWRTNNKFSLELKTFADPKTPSLTTLVGTATPNRYLYTTTPSGCVSPTAASGTVCSAYNLSSVSEVDSTKSFTATSLN